MWTATTAPAASVTSESTSGRDLLTVAIVSTSTYLIYSNSDLIKIGSSFKYTTAVTTFSGYGQQCVMSVYVYRSGLTPTTVYSDEIYVEVGK